MASPKGKEQRDQLDPEAWLDGALGMIVKTGVQGLRVQDLAASLDATTGSLYWHFEDRQAMVRALVERWAEQSTEEVARRIEGSSLQPSEKLLELMRFVSDNRATTADLAIRAWAATHRDAAKVVARTDAHRYEIVYGLFTELGFPEEESVVRTRMFLCYESCERFVFPRTSRADRERYLLERHRIYCDD